MKHVLFPRGPLETVVNGWTTAFYTGDPYCGFIDINNEVNPLEAARIELAAIPITKANLVFSEENISDEARNHQLKKYHKLLRNLEDADEWVFQFALVSNLGGFGTSPEELLLQYNGICTMYRYCKHIDQLALRRLARLKDELAQLTKDVFRPEQSPGQNPIIPPLSKEDIIWLNKKALALQADRESRLLVQSEVDLQKLLRYFDCVNGSIRGYSHCSKEAASHLISQSYIPFHIESPYLIHQWFRALCRIGAAYSALGFYLEHKQVLDRPKYLFGEVSDINLYIQGCAVTRLIDGLRLSINRGYDSVLKVFLSEEEIQSELDTLPFFASLIQGLNQKGYELACEVYRHYGKNYGEIPWLRRTFPVGEKAHVEIGEILNEDTLIQRIQAGHYYDEPSFWNKEEV